MLQGTIRKPAQSKPSIFDDFSYSEDKLIRTYKITHEELVDKLKNKRLGIRFAFVNGQYRFSSEESVVKALGLKKRRAHKTVKATEGVGTSGK